MSSWPSWVREHVREFVVAATGGPWPQMQAHAARLLEELPAEQPSRPVGGRAAAPGRKRKRHGVDKSMLAFAPPTSTRPDRRVDRNERMREMRAIVLARAAGRCEFRCIVAGEPTEAHHLLGGADRRALESEYSLAGICEDCHGRCNASPTWARTRGLAWARRMATEARAEGDAAAAVEFSRTAEHLEARIALADVQARPVTPTTTTEET